MSQPLPLLLARIALAVTVVVVVATVRLLLLAGRLGLRLLGLVGFRGARLGWLAATLVGVWWAAHQMGSGPAARLAVIGWAAWAASHHRAAVRRHPATRRLVAATNRQADALATATKTLQSRRQPR
jgi:hypothetical protein